MFCIGPERKFGSLTWTKGHVRFAEVWRGFVRLCDVGWGCWARWGEAGRFGFDWLGLEWSV